MRGVHRHGSLVVATALACACDPSGATAASTAASGHADDGPVAEVLVALVGDMGRGEKSMAVYQRVLDEGADLLIMLGDFGDGPDEWSEKTSMLFGDGFPVFGVIGNHDVTNWTGYQARLAQRLAKTPDAVCKGDLGVASSCRYRGLHIVLSGIGTVGSPAEHEAYLARTLAADTSRWSLCIWHKNQRDLQAGDQDDAVGWPAYRRCQDDGSIIVMGHEHSYARTRTLTDIGNAAHGHGAIGGPDRLAVGPGRTFTAVAGLGGKSIRPYAASLHKDDTWWGTLYTADYYRRNGVEIADFTADAGVLFIRFNVDDNPSAARGYFKTVHGEVIDEFDIQHE